MRISDAIGTLATAWGVPISELMTYHRALRAANAIPAYAPGRAADNISEDALVRFVLAYASSRLAKECAQNLKHVLVMKPWRPRFSDDSPAFLRAGKIADVLAGAIRHERASADRKHGDPILFEFILDADAVFVHHRSIPPTDGHDASSQYLTFAGRTEGRPELRTETDFRQTKQFGGRTVATLAQILGS